VEVFLTDAQGHSPCDSRGDFTVSPRGSRGEWSHSHSPPSYNRSSPVRRKDNLRARFRVRQNIVGFMP
jgi:hypothetical protein